MDWIRAHLTLVYGIGIGLLLLIGAVLVSDKFATSGQVDDAYTWGSYGGGGRFIPSEQFQGSSREAPPYEQPLTIAELSRNLQTNPDRIYASLVPGASVPQNALYYGTTTAEGALEFGADAVDALLKSIKPSAYTGNLTSGETLDEIYQFIPKNIGATGISDQRQMNKTQRDLYNYGNEAGSSIELFSSIWAPLQANIHRSFVEDRSNAEKATSLKRLGDALVEVGLSLSYMEFIPIAMKTAHRDLATTYQEVGEKTILIADARTDDELLTAIEAYNVSADEFLRAYLSVSTVFNLNSVTFGDTDPGRMFVYTASGL